MTPGLPIMKLRLLWVFQSHVGTFAVRASNGPAFEHALLTCDSGQLPSGPFAIWTEPMMGDYEEACYRAWGIVRNPYHTLTGEMALHLMLSLTTPEKVLRLVAPDQCPPPFDPANITITPIRNPNETMTSHTPCPHCGCDLLWSDDRGAHCDGCDDFDPADTTITPIIMTPKPTQEPRTIQHDGKTYRLHQKARQISADPPFSEGPFYSLAGVDPQDWAFLPDSRFLAGLSETPSFMHCMQQRAAVATPRPA